MTRKPLCLISCSHCLPEGQFVCFCRKAWRDEPGRARYAATCGCGINKVAQCLLQLGGKAKRNNVRHLPLKLVSFRAFWPSTHISTHMIEERKKILLDFYFS